MGKILFFLFTVVSMNMSRAQDGVGPVVEPERKKDTHNFRAQTGYLLSDYTFGHSIFGGVRIWENYYLLIGTSRQNFHTFDKYIQGTRVNHSVNLDAYELMISADMPRSGSWGWELAVGLSYLRGESRMSYFPFISSQSIEKQSFEGLSGLLRPSIYLKGDFFGAQARVGLGLNTRIFRQSLTYTRPDGSNFEEDIPKGLGNSVYVYLEVLCGNSTK